MIDAFSIPYLVFSGSKKSFTSFPILFLFFFNQLNSILRIPAAAIAIKQITAKNITISAFHILFDN